MVSGMSIKFCLSELFASKPFGQLQTSQCLDNNHGWTALALDNSVDLWSQNFLMFVL